MPSITASYRDLCALLGKVVDQNEMCERLDMLGMEAEASGDKIKIEVAHNRPDLLSSEGVARALKGFLQIETGLPEYNTLPSGVVVEVDHSVGVIRPCIAAGILRNVKLTSDAVASIMEAQEKLDYSLCRKRRKGSIGVYDLGTITPPLRYITTLPDGVRFVPLDSSREMSPAEILRENPKGIEYGSLINDLSRYPLLVDSSGVVLSMPPIINSEDTRVTENTKGLFIDVTGHDQQLINKTLTVLMTGFAERGFELRSVVVKYPGKRIITPKLKPRKFRMDIRDVNKIAGINIRSRQASKLASLMRYGVLKAKGEKLALLIPPYRLDILHKIDFIEDMVIGYGYDNLEPTIPKVLTVGGIAPIEKISDKARKILTGSGFMGVMTYTLSSTGVNFELMRTKGEAAEIANPISEEYSILRDSLLPSLMLVLKQNRHNPLPHKIFEVGDVVLLDGQEETGAKNSRQVAAAVIGGGLGFTYLKAVAESLLRELRNTWEVRATLHPSFTEGRAAEFLVKGERIGMVGELHPELIRGFELEHAVAAFSINLR